MSIELNQAARQAFDERVADFLTQYPETERVELLFPDLNGVMRGKWLPVSALPKLAEGTVRLPRSTCFLDIWSCDVEEIGLAIEVGDPDGVCLPVIDSLAPVPWSSTPAAQIIITMFDPETGEPCEYEPRQQLAKQVKKFAERGLTPVVATELEFYLIDSELAEGGYPQAPVGNDGHRLVNPQVYELEVMDRFDAVLKGISTAGQAQHLPIDTTIAEFGPGQFEINLIHVADALMAADQTVALKRVVKQVAQQYGFEATFMAKPYAEHTGSGMHVHTSLLDEDGNNIFSSDNDEIKATLKQAVAGLVSTMPDMQVICAPHANSYRRFQPGFYAPVSPCWGYDHRAAAVRVPEIKGKGARLEHRVSGADANPYLVIATVLAGMYHGLETECDVGPAISRETDVDTLEPMTPHWSVAIDNFMQSAFAGDVFGAEYQRVFATCKMTEERTFARTITDFECQTYLRRV